MEYLSLEISVTTKRSKKKIIIEEEEDMNIPTEQQPDDSQTNSIDSTISEQVAESGEEDVSVVEQPAPEEVATDNTNPASSLNVHIIYSVLICTLVVRYILAVDT